MKVINRIIISLFLFCFLLPTSSAYAFLGLFGDGNISLVKDSTFSQNENITIGKLLDTYQYIENGEWTSFETSRGEQVVQFRARYSNLAIAQALSEYLFSDYTKNPYGIFTLKTAENLNKLNFEVYLLMQFAISANGENFQVSFVGYEYKGNSESLYIDNVLNEISRNELSIYLTINTPESNTVYYALSKAVIEEMKENTPNQFEAFSYITSSNDVKTYDKKPLVRARLENFVFEDISESIRAEMIIDIFDTHYKQANTEDVSHLNILQSYSLEVTNDVKLVRPKYMQFRGEDRNRYIYTIFYKSDGVDRVELSRYYINANDELFNQNMYNFFEGIEENFQETTSINMNEAQDVTDEYPEDNPYPFIIQDSGVVGGIAVEYFDMNAFNLFLETTERLGARWMCNFAAQCFEENGKFICEDGELGNLEGIITGDTITITSEPVGACGMNGSMLGTYIYQE